MAEINDFDDSFLGRETIRFGSGKADMHSMTDYRFIDIPQDRNFPLADLIDALPWEGSDRSFKSLSDITIEGYDQTLGNLGFRLEREELKDDKKGFIRIRTRDSKPVEMPLMNISYDLETHNITGVNTGRPLNEVTSVLQPLLRNNDTVLAVAHGYLTGEREGIEVSLQQKFGGQKDFGSIPNWDNKDIEHQTWEDPAHIERFEYARQVFRPANREVVKKVLDTYVPNQGTIIEVGAGTGELVKVIPEYQTRVIATEQSARSIQKNPTERKVRADAYELPFADESAAAVVGYASYDTLLDLPLALEEVERVLEKNGAFVHFLDIDACANTVFFNEQRRGMVVLPSLDRGERDEPAVKIIPLEEVMSRYNTLPKPLQSFLGNYIGNQEVQYRNLMSSPQYDHARKEFARAVDSWGIGEQTTFKSYFKQKLEEAARDFAKLDIEVSEYRDATAIVSRKDLTAEPPDHWDSGTSFDITNENQAINDTGHMIMMNNPMMARSDPDQIIARSSMYVLVARKK